MSVDATFVDSHILDASKRGFNAGACAAAEAAMRSHNSFRMDLALCMPGSADRRIVSSGAPVPIANTHHPEVEASASIK